MNPCILFDCDGTLVDSERLCNIALVLKFRELRVELDADELVIRFRGWKLAKILDVLTAEHGVLLPDDFIASYRNLVSELFETDLKPIEGVHSALDDLDFPKAVVSSGPLPKIKQALRVCGLDRYFERTFTAPTKSASGSPIQAFTCTLRTTWDIRSPIVWSSTMVR
jgi:beta-phosphoglucomutase-like phosphatase (HAD superfamily)